MRTVAVILAHDRYEDQLALSRPFMICFGPWWSVNEGQFGRMLEKWNRNVLWDNALNERRSRSLTNLLLPIFINNLQRRSPVRMAHPKQTKTDHSLSHGTTHTPADRSPEPRLPAMSIWPVSGCLKYQ
jgi:hypothetical protein